MRSKIVWSMQEKDFKRNYMGAIDENNRWWIQRILWTNLKIHIHEYEFKTMNGWDMWPEWSGWGSDKRRYRKEIQTTNGLRQKKRTSTVSVWERHWIEGDKSRCKCGNKAMGQVYSYTITIGLAIYVCNQTVTTTSCWILWLYLIYIGFFLASNSSIEFFI